MGNGSQDKARARRPGRPKDPAKREAILDAAQRLFYARGVGPVGLEDVAGTAGVSRMTLYSHFGGKPPRYHLSSKPGGFTYQARLQA